MRRSSIGFWSPTGPIMPIGRADIGQSSIRRKVLACPAAVKTHQHVERFAFHNLRVLIVTTEPDRLRSMLAVLYDVMLL
jgi:hypothetical protein